MGLYPITTRALTIPFSVFFLCRLFKTVFKSLSASRVPDLTKRWSLYEGFRFSKANGTTEIGRQMIDESQSPPTSQYGSTEYVVVHIHLHVCDAGLDVFLSMAMREPVCKVYYEGCNLRFIIPNSAFRMCWKTIILTQPRRTFFCRAFWHRSCVP